MTEYKITEAQNGFILSYQDYCINEEGMVTVNQVFGSPGDDSNKALIELLEELINIFGDNDKYGPKTIAVVEVPGRKCDIEDLKYDDYDWRLQDFAERFQKEAKEVVDKYEKEYNGN